VEIHEQFDDVAIIRSGHGVLRTGSKVKGQKESGTPGAGEWIGGVIEDGSDRKLSPGDFIVVPATLAHQYIPSPGESLTYWIIKVRHPKTSSK
jgi:mannose-6-phosphate isomerase-like protein (cupin superfamily)